MEHDDILSSYTNKIYCSKCTIVAQGYVIEYEFYGRWKTFDILYVIGYYRVRLYKVIEVYLELNKDTVIQGFYTF